MAEDDQELFWVPHPTEAWLPCEKLGGGRYEDYLYRKMKVEERGNKLKSWKDKQSPLIKVLFTIFVLLLIIGWVLFAPECELC